VRELQRREVGVPRRSIAAVADAIEVPVDVDETHGRSLRTKYNGTYQTAPVTLSPGTTRPRGGPSMMSSTRTNRVATIGRAFAARSTCPLAA
jgi:hypothetical protein